MRRLIDTVKDLCPACRERVEGEARAQAVRVRTSLAARPYGRPIPNIYIDDPDGRPVAVEGVAGG